MFRSVIFKTLIIYLFSVLVVCSIENPLLDLDGRIVGGASTTIEKHPYQVSLRRPQRHACGGAIYSESVIITAAHCVRNRTAADLTIKAGSTHKNLNGTVHEVELVFMHPDYNSTTRDNDIAVLILTNKLNFTEAIQPIKLPDVPPAPGSNVTVTGWGATKVGGGSIKRLREVTVQIVTTANCTKSYAPRVITEGMICAGVATGGKDSCQGDSGGPMVQDGKLVGVVSWGKGCALKDFPGVYANVTAYKPWIEELAKGIIIFE